MVKTEQIERAQWGSRVGFILAAMGSAVGFGSIARFPMNVANNGGAIFLILYAAIMVFIGIPLMMTEFSLGRSSQKNAVGTMKHQTGDPKSKWRATGLLWILVPAFFLSWYAVVSGWVLRYAFASMTGAYFESPDDYLAGAQEGPQALYWTIAVLTVTGAVVVFGIAKGIEKLNLVLMPTLFAMILAIAIYALFQDGAGAGIAFYLQPDINAINLGVITAAFGQAFFSLSLFEGAMLTYASYLPRKASLAENAGWIAGSTLVFATVCGFMIFPLLTSFGEIDRGAAGLSLIFGPLSQAFAAMPSPIGNIVGTMFFTATFFAAFTSAVSLTEPAIAYLVEERGIDRRRASIITVLAIYAMGIVAALSLPYLGFAGGPFTDMLVILGGLLLVIFVGYRISKAKARAQMDECESGLRISGYAYPLVKYVMPLALTVLLFFAVLGTPCALSGINPDPDALGANNRGHGVLEQFSHTVGGRLGLLGCDPIDADNPNGLSDPLMFGGLAGGLVLGIVLGLLAAVALGWTLYDDLVRQRSTPLEPVAAPTPARSTRSRKGT